MNCSLWVSETIHSRILQSLSHIPDTIGDGSGNQRKSQVVATGREDKKLRNAKKITPRIIKMLKSKVKYSIIVKRYICGFFENLYKKFHDLIIFLKVIQEFNFFKNKNKRTAMSRNENWKLCSIIRIFVFIFWTQQ